MSTVRVSTASISRGARILLLLMALSSEVAADAGHCDQTLLAESETRGDAKAYHKESAGHCEGLYRRKVASTGIEIIGLSRGTLDTSQPANKLSWSTSLDIELRVLSAGDTHFRMDVDLPKTTHEFYWPTKTLNFIGCSSFRTAPTRIF